MNTKTTSQVAASIIETVAQTAGRNFENTSVYEVLLAKLTEALAERDHEIARLNNVIAELEEGEDEVEENAGIGTERAAPYALHVLTPSPELSRVIGEKPRSRVEVTKAVWAYIMKHKIQNPKDRKNLSLDEKLKAVCGNQAEISMFELTRYINEHLH